MAASIRIGILLFDGVEELDWVGPFEVLASWAKWFPDDGIEVFTFSLGSSPVSGAKGSRSLPDHVVTAEPGGVPDPPEMDVIVVPGGEGTRPLVGDETVRSLLRDQAARGRLMTSVCTGALLLADAGLLDRRPATTHWGALDLLARIGQDVEVRGDERFVDDGDIVTASGVSAGIDMALHLVARLGSPERAREVRRYIQYDPEPPV